MASQPPAGPRLTPASPAGPDRGSESPPEPHPTLRAKRRRDTGLQPTRPSLVGSQPDALNTAPPTAKGPINASGIATRCIVAALNDKARHYKAWKDVFLTIA